MLAFDKAHLRKDEGSNFNIFQQPNPSISQQPNVVICRHPHVGLRRRSLVRRCGTDRARLLHFGLCALLSSGARHEPPVYQAMAGRPASVWQPACREVLVLYPASDGVAASPEELPNGIQADDGAGWSGLCWSVHVVLAWQAGFTGIVPQDSRRQSIPRHSGTAAAIVISLFSMNPPRVRRRPRALSSPAASLSGFS